MTEGFEELKAALESQIENLSNRRRLRSQSSGNFFSDRERTPRVLFALVLRKYIYQAFLCGTDRIFISDHQTFLGFFKYEIIDDKMTIDYKIYMKAISTPTDNGESVTVTTRKKN